MVKYLNTVKVISVKNLTTTKNEWIVYLLLLLFNDQIIWPNLFTP